MLPDLSPYDISDKRLRNPELRGNFGLTHFPWDIKFANTSNLVLSQFRQRVIFAARHQMWVQFAHGYVATLSHAILHIATVATREEMNRPVASRKIAVMTDQNSRRDLAVSQSPRFAMNFYSDLLSVWSFVVGHSITISVESAGPLKAWITVPRKRQVVRERKHGFPKKSGVVHWVPKHVFSLAHIPLPRIGMT
jgi:hypothetical protein